MHTASDRRHDNDPFLVATATVVVQYYAITEPLASLVAIQIVQLTPVPLQLLADRLDPSSR